MLQKEMDLDGEVELELDTQRAGGGGRVDLYLSIVSI